MLKGAKGECNQVRQFGEFASQDAVTPEKFQPALLFE